MKNGNYSRNRGVEVKQLKKALETIKDIQLTEEEQKSFDWLLTWESSTVENICSIIEKAKGKSINKKSQELLLDWVKAAVQELDKLKENRLAWKILI
ncbi:MAG: hypothetical protein ACOCRK_09995 [bacterium]